MARVETFSVSKAGAPSFEVSFLAPETLDDPRWNEIIQGEDVKSAINTLALQSLVVKIQAAARAEYDSGQEAVQKIVNEYVYGGAGRRGGRRAAKARVSIASGEAKRLRFTPEQIAALRAAGVSIEE